jgi:hypothetical protein
MTRETVEVETPARLATSTIDIGTTCLQNGSSVVDSGDIMAGSRVPTFNQNHNNPAPLQITIIFHRSLILSFRQLLPLENQRIRVSVPRQGLTDGNVGLYKRIRVRAVLSLGI